MSAELLTVVLPLRISPEMLERLQDLAEREDRTVAWLVRKAVSEMLEGRDADA